MPPILLPSLQKRYDVKVSSPACVYMGRLQNVVPDFNYNQTIGSAFVQTTITVAQSADVVGLPSTPILDESGQPILDENSQIIYDEGAADVVGSTNTNALIANNNLIQVYEYSKYWPNGLLVFSGYISKWQAVFGGSDNVVITAISNGQDLNNYLVQGGNTVDQSQLLFNNSYFSYFATKGAASAAVGQTFTTGASISSLSAIQVQLENIQPGETDVVYISLYNAVNGTLIANTNQISLTNINSLAPYTFSFATPVTVSPSTQYFFVVWTTGTANGVNVGYDSNASYAGGGMYYYNYGGGGGSTLFGTATPALGTNSQLYFETFYITSPNLVPFINDDVSSILATIMGTYNAAGGLITPPTGGYLNTGNLTTYSFKTQTMVQAIQTLIGLAPANWYWYVDPATGTLQFAQSNTVADFILVKGRHLNELDVTATRENIKNNIYFTGGDDGSGHSTNIFVQVQNALNGNRVGLGLLSDNRVNSTSGGVSTARQIAQEYANDNANETYITNVTIQDGSIDTNQFKLGKMVGFAGFSPFINNLVLQVVAVNKQPDQVVLQLGTLPIRSSQAIADIQSQLAYSQTVANPATPS